MNRNVIYATQLELGPIQRFKKKQALNDFLLSRKAQLAASISLHHPYEMWLVIGCQIWCKA